MPTAFPTFLPESRFLSHLGAIVQTILDDKGWQFSCLVENEAGAMVPVAVNSALLADPENLLSLVLHQASGVFYDIFQEEPYLAYRINAAQYPLGAAPEVVPGMSTASVAMWASMICEAFEQLAADSEAKLGLANHLSLEGWYHAFLDSLSQAPGARPILLLAPSVPAPALVPDYILSPPARPREAGRPASTGSNFS